MGLGSRPYQQLQSIVISNQSYSIVPPLVFHILHFTLFPQELYNYIMHHLEGTVQPEILMVFKVGGLAQILEESKFGSGAPPAYYIIISVVQL